jgi:hypothetical protein
LMIVLSPMGRLNPPRAARTRKDEGPPPAGTASVRAGPFGWLGARSRPPAGRIGVNASTGGRRANGPEQLCTLRAEPSVG